MAESKPETKKALSLKAPEELVNKMKFIVWQDRLESLLALQLTAWNKEVAAWEKKNGAITLERLKEARII